MQQSASWSKWCQPWLPSSCLTQRSYLPPKLDRILFPSMPDPTESKQCPPLIEYLDGTRPFDDSMPTLDMRRLKEPFLCNICVDFFDTPYMLECGHTFCAACILSWLERHKTCPQCRIDIGNRPVPAYAVQHQVTVVRTMIFGHQVPAHTDLDREAQRAFQELYPVARRSQYIQDREDQVNRCGACGWELDEEGICPGCGEQYRHAAQQGEPIPSYWGAVNDITDIEDEEDDDDDQDLSGFVVDSDEPIEWEEMSEGDLNDYDSDESMRHNSTPVVISEDDSSSSSSNESDSDDSDAVVYLGPTRSIRIPDTEDEESDNENNTWMSVNNNTEIGDEDSDRAYVSANSGSDGDSPTAKSENINDNNQSESDDTDSDETSTSDSDSDSDNAAEGLRALASNSSSSSSSTSSNHCSCGESDDDDVVYDKGTDATGAKMTSDTSNKDNDNNDTSDSSDHDEENIGSSPSKKRTIDNISKDDDDTLKNNTQQQPSHQRKRQRNKGRNRGQGGRSRGRGRTRS